MSEPRLEFHVTKQHDFKQTYRARMEKTGERYPAARAMLLRSGGGPAAVPGLFKGYPTLGGMCRDTGALRNVLAAAGILAPHTGEPLSEAVVTGLCGGVGFLYALFEYKGWPPMLSVMCRFDTMPDSFIAGGLARLGVPTTVQETSSAATARKALDAAIEAGKPPLCVVDCVGLLHEGEAGPMQMAGMAPTVVAVAGVQGDTLLIDDGGVDPRRMTHEQFARARGLYKKGKNRLITIDGAPPKVDVKACIRKAVAATGDRYTNAPYKGFASNFGLAGLDKWRRLLTDAKDAKGWPSVFPEGRLAYLALRRTYDGIEHDFTPPAAGRPMYAEFLTEAAAITGVKGFEKASELYKRSGAAWSKITVAIAGCGDGAIAQGCGLGDSAREIFDEAGCPRRAEIASIVNQRTTLAQTCKLPAERAAELYGRLAGHVGEVLALEREAAGALVALG